MAAVEGRPRRRLGWEALAALGCLGALMLASPATAAEPRIQQWAAMDFAWIPGGCFEQGVDPASVKPAVPGHMPAAPRADEAPRRELCVKGFWLATRELTRDDWQRITGSTLTGPGQGSWPMLGLNWPELQSLLDRMNGEPQAKVRFRLPTEAEWEYACDAGRVPAIPAEIDEAGLAVLKAQAWFRDNLESPPEPRPVASLAANAFGLYDMLGNAWEWTSDAYQGDAYARPDAASPVRTAADRPVIRGGSFKSDRWQVRCGARNHTFQDDHLDTLGLRLAADDRTPP